MGGIKIISLYLIRHGQTLDNIKNRFSGITDSVLSDKGLEQSFKTIELLKNKEFEYIYTSPLKRSYFIGKRLNSKKELKYILDFREMDFGIFENLTIKEIKKNHNEEFKKMIEEQFEYNFIKGENIIGFHNRVINSLENILENKKGDICICAHAGVIRCIISHLISKSHIYHWNFKIDNCSITKINIENNFSVLEKLNDINHL